MDKRRPLLVIILLCIITINLIPIQSEPTDIENIISIESVQTPLIEENQNLNLVAESSSSNWNTADNSSIENNFIINNSSDDSTKNFSLDNCDDWSLNNNFNFSDIRTEKITNGDAETTDELWTDYLPPKYEGNVTREDSFPIGDVISGDYSWYFNLSTSDHAVIIGFDDPINVSSDSVIFSFSYSLLRNNLGTSYDSNICIRLFFQFDIYIFFWFNGNVGVLSNVTGPGGYADLLVDEASFDGANHNYSLNITALGLELFDQKPDQLRSLAVQTWGELSSFEMEYILDDISLTDQIDPSAINLNVNSNPISGQIGKGSVVFEEPSQSVIDYVVDYSYQDKLYFNYVYEITGLNIASSQRKCDFINWDTIEWNETTIDTVTLPSISNELIVGKIIPVDWVVDQVLVDDIPQSYQLININSTYNKIKFIINSYNSIEYYFNSNNLIDNVILSDYQISHNDNLSVSIESDIFNEEMYLYIVESENKVYSIGPVLTDDQGDALLTNIQLDSEIPRDFHSLFVFWNSVDNIGIGKRDFEIITYPTDIVPLNNKIVANYKQNFLVEVDYINLETIDSVDLANVEYSWLFGSGTLQQDIDKDYFAEITNEQANPGIYYLNVTGNKNGHATSMTTIEIEIVFEDYNLTLITPDNALPGEYINFYSFVQDNLSLPISNVKVRFEINGSPLSDTWTNITGFSELTYPVSPVYIYPTINVSCSIIINEISCLTRNKTIDITISELPQAAQLNSIVYNSNKGTNDTSFFNYTIDYPVFGKNWYVNIPTGMNIVNAMIIAESSIIQANIIDNYITWEREINSTLAEDDILELEIFKPQLTLSPDIQRNSLSIDIVISTNNLPYENLVINITRDIQWESFDQWELNYNGVSITEKSSLAITSSSITFHINSTIQDTVLTYQLTGAKSNFIQMSPTTVILGVGILVLTIVSIVLLLKKKSNVSLDIQV
ncbi:MAG: hypothetical protein FK733_07920 [Asgard group archaeon]|nr:hypothetical protein [Asgard group archaeon]